jgi:CheY-like chemotaxis protein
VPRTVLVADDSPTIQSKAKGILTGEGLDVVTVSNGVAAIKKLPTVKPLLVLADVAMPGKDGYEVCDFVKNSPDLRHIPVLLIFSDSDPYNEEQGSRCHADGRIQKMAAGKPFDPEQLITTVNRFLAQAEAAALPITVPAGAAVPPEFSMVTQPVDEEPQFRDRRGVDVTSLPQEVAFEQSVPDETPAASPNPTLSEFRATEVEPAPPSTSMMDAEFAAEPAPAAYSAASEAPISTEPLFTEDPMVEQFHPQPPPAPERTMMFRVPSDIAEPILTDELAPRSEVYEAPESAEGLVAPEAAEAPEAIDPPAPFAARPANEPVSATTLESFSLSDAASGQAPFASLAQEPAREAAGEYDSQTAASPASPTLDAKLIYTIVQKVVTRMSPRAVSSQAIDEMAGKMAEEITAELDSESSDY